MLLHLGQSHVIYRVHTHHCHSHSLQCKVYVTLLLSHKTGYQYLSSVGELHREYHTELDEVHKIVTEKDCDKDDVTLMHIM